MFTFSYWHIVENANAASQSRQLKTSSVTSPSESQPFRSRTKYKIQIRHAKHATPERHRVINNDDSRKEEKNTDKIQD